MRVLSLPTSCPIAFYSKHSFLQKGQAQQKNLDARPKIYEVMVNLSTLRECKPPDSELMHRVEIVEEEAFNPPDRDSQK